MTFTTLSRTALAAALLLLLASGASAQTYAEAGDAGDTIGTAQAAGTPAYITGGGAFDEDIDMYGIVAPADGTLFLGVCEGSGNDRTFDTELFLYDSAGTLLVSNDDRCSGFGSQIETVVTAGTYYVGVCGFNCVDGGGVGPAAGPVHSGFDGMGLGDTYRLAVSGTSVGYHPVRIRYLGSTADPQRGDFVFIRARATNNASSTIRTRVYFTVAYPNGVTRTYSVLSQDFPGLSSVQVQNQKRIKFPIPSDAPAGTYTVTLYAADDISAGGTIYDSDSFSFTLPAPLAKGEIASPEAGPNPFRSTTTIRYELADDTEVDLRVFDVQGRQVASLASGVQSAGAHSAVFAADDLPGGVYVWRLAIGGEVQTGRVSLAR